MEIRMPGKGIVVPETVSGRIGGILKKGRWYEQEMLSHISNLRLPGIYLDVGANIGNHTVYFAANTACTRVFSFEPEEYPRKLLREFIDLNDLSLTVDIVPLAVSERPGEVSYFTMTGAPEGAKSGNACRLDDIVAEPVALIKLDIEGGEASALRGASAILQRDKPAIFVEIHDDHQMSEVMSAIGPIGYKSTGNVFNASPTYEFRA